MDNWSNQDDFAGLRGHAPVRLKDAVLQAKITPPGPYLQFDRGRARGLIGRLRRSRPRGSGPCGIRCSSDGEVSSPGPSCPTADSSSELDPRVDSIREVLNASFLAVDDGLPTGGWPCSPGRGRGRGAWSWASSTSEEILIPPRLRSIVLATRNGIRFPGRCRRVEAVVALRAALLLRKTLRRAAEEGYLGARAARWRIEGADLVLDKRGSIWSAPFCAENGLPLASARARSASLAAFLSSDLGRPGPPYSSVRGKSSRRSSWSGRAAAGTPRTRRVLLDGLPDALGQERGLLDALDPGEEEEELLAAVAAEEVVLADRVFRTPARSRRRRLPASWPFRSL